ncbi:MAG TPA: ABC transporter ATP-binding protein [Chitinophagaceae bacterium]|jgi:ABC-type multidrug transport system ATPase subunit|nr:ABC transporter ATP-binding protein [Chitinophagaceae bacterium]
MPAVINVTHLSKRFQEVLAVDDLSFSVEAGQVYGFLGQNGAGKSTTIRMLLTLITPSDGKIELFGMDLQKHRKDILRQVGAIIERPDLYRYLTALENLRIFAAMSGMKPSRRQLMDQLDQVGLAARANSKVKTYSQGMKQRLGIATALVHNPGLIVLDEPTNGLDPQGIADIRHLILQLSRELGKTIFISSHLLSEMELVADSMLIIHKGKKVVEGKVADLFDPDQTLVALQTTDNRTTANGIRTSEWRDMLKECTAERILLKLPKTSIPAFTRYLVEAGVMIQSISPRHSLEDYFLSLTTANQHVETFAN